MSTILIPEYTRGHGVNLPKTLSCTAGSYHYFLGVLLQELRGEEVWDDIDRPIINQPLGSDPTYNEPVRALIRPMQDRRPRSK
jgi:hypothetical protein